MKKLNITKKQFGESRYFTNKYGTLKYVSENGKFYRTSKGKVLKFKESNDECRYCILFVDKDDLSIDDIQSFNPDPEEAKKECKDRFYSLRDKGYNIDILFMKWTTPDDIENNNAMWEERLSGYSNWEEYEQSQQYSESKEFVNEGAGAGYDITVKEIEIGKIVSVKLGDDKGSWAEFEATIKPCYAWVTAEGYYDVFCQDETVGIDGGTISGEVFDIGYFESEEEALEYAKSELEGRLIDIKTMYGAGWMHQYLPEDGDIHFDGDLKNTDYYNISAINIKSQEMSDIVNAGHDDVYSDDNEEDEFDESWLGDKVKDGWNKVKDGAMSVGNSVKYGAKKLGKKIGDMLVGPFRKGDHIQITGRDGGETYNGTIVGYSMGDNTYKVLLGSEANETSMNDESKTR